MKLHGYFRSSASYRVRIALNLKGVPVEHVPHHLRRGEQRSNDFLELNPQGLVPALVLDDGVVLTQSLAIIDWLDEKYPEPPLLPADSIHKARVRAFALAIACDIHPVQNLKVLARVRAMAGEAQSLAWAAEVIEEGLRACEKLIAETAGPFCFGIAPDLADICLIPQLANARRFQVDLKPFARLREAELAAMALPAFADAAPDRQSDAES